MATPLLLFSLLFLPFLPQGTFRIVGHIRDDAGVPISTIRVSLLGENFEPIRTIFTDSAGQFQFRGLREGTYLIRVEPSGTPYQELTQQVELRSGSLRRGAGEEPWPLELVVKRKKPQADSAPGTTFVQTVPAGAQKEYEKAVRALKNEQPDAAVTALQRAVELFPDYFAALELLGTEYVKHGQYAKAVAVLNHALEVNRSAPKSLYALGVAHLKLSDFGAAIDSLQKASAQDPNNANVYMMLGLAQGHNRALDEAVAAFRKAYQLGGPGAADAHLYLAGIYNTQAKYAEAIRELELYLKEAKDLKDDSQVKGMIKKLKEKAGTKN